MAFIGPSQQFAVAPAVAVSGQMEAFTGRQYSFQTFHFLCPVTVSTAEKTGQSTVLYLYLCTQYRHLQILLCQKWSDPTVYTRTDHVNISSFLQCLAQDLECRCTQDMPALMGIPTAETIELIQLHAPEKIRKYLLLRLIIGVQMQLHQYQQRTVKQKSHKETDVATGKADKVDEGIARGQRAVKVESKNLFHSD